MRKVMPKDVDRIIEILLNVTSIKLFEDLKKANPRVSDEKLAEVVIHAMSYAKSEGLEIR